MLVIFKLLILGYWNLFLWDPGLDRSSQDGRFEEAVCVWIVHHKMEDLKKLCASGSFISRWKIWRSCVRLDRSSQDGRFEEASSPASKIQ
ncbi:hypothetical protein HanRHA438_Chr14g0657191 [Helianthus annuus]|nr:hypothetical protein HanRHA438_Chr14g0657191 [Helianthus annuus]